MRLDSLLVTTITTILFCLSLCVGNSSQQDTPPIDSVTPPTNETLNPLSPSNVTNGTIGNETIPEVAPTVVEEPAPVETIISREARGLISFGSASIALIIVCVMTYYYIIKKKQMELAGPGALNESEMVVI
jgi:hypothetical protein